MALVLAEKDKDRQLESGYWTLKNISISLTSGSAHVTLGLYANPEAYQTNPTDNILRESQGYTIGIQEGFAEIFQADRPIKDILADVYLFIREFKYPEEETGYFNNAIII